MVWGAQLWLGTARCYLRFPVASKDGVHRGGKTEWVAVCTHLVAGGFPWLQLLQAETKEGEDDAGKEDHKGEEGDRPGGT